MISKKYCFLLSFSKNMPLFFSDEFEDALTNPNSPFRRQLQQQNKGDYVAIWMHCSDFIVSTQPNRIKILEKIGNALKNLKLEKEVCVGCGT